MSTRLVLATGTCGNLVTMACSDSDFDCPLGGSRLEAEVDAGSLYYLRLGTGNGVQGTGTIHLSYLACEAAYEVEQVLPRLSQETSDATSINAAGTICGRNVNKAITWSPASGLVNIAGTQPVAYATDINDAGVVVGSMGNSIFSQPTPFVATNNVASGLALPAAASSAYPLALNNAGTIVGESTGKAIRWEGGVPSYLALPLGPYSAARGINQVGDVCGFMGGVAGMLGARHGFVVSGGTVIDVVPPIGASSEANAINDLGQVAGFLRIANPSGPGTVQRAFLWEDGAYTVIEPWPGYSESVAVAVNNTGVVVGLMYAGGAKVPFVWYGGAAVPIGELVLLAANESITKLTAVNDGGQMAGLLIWNSPSASDQGSPVRLLPLPVSADLDCDGTVGPADLALLLGSWGPCGAGVPCLADLDHSGDVGAPDLAILLGAWG